jgi:F-type H+-transporting ATPase subunit epsilon
MSSRQLRLVVVTPETTLLDEPVDALRFPLFDGQIGILPSRAPLVGRLGYGELKITQGASTRSYFVDGGFVQVKDDVVSLLTQRAIPAGEIDVAAAEHELRAALARRPTTESDFSAQARDQERARNMIATSGRSA